MKASLNYTGRKRIRREDIQIRLEDTESLPGFQLLRLDIARYGFPNDGVIYLDAYHRAEQKRFRVSSVEDINNAGFSPKRENLNDFSSPGNVKFRLLVIDPKDHKILGMAAPLIPERQASVSDAERRSDRHRTPLLPVEFKDLHTELWRVDYEDEQNGPILSINSRIPGIETIARSDPGFFLAVYPAVLREILTRIVTEYLRKGELPEWAKEKPWLQFTEERLGVSVPPFLKLQRPESAPPSAEEELSDWVKQSVTRFCDIHHGRGFTPYCETIKNKNE